MCGIPMLPPSDAVTGKRLTFDQALEHIGGMENLISDEGRQMIHDCAQDYIWQYPDGRAFCTACGAALPRQHEKHNTWITCPACGKGVLFRHEARGHMNIYDQFVLYEWRRSAIDGETVVLTAAHVWRNSSGAQPENAVLNAAPSAIYVFRPGRAVTVYKDSGWVGGRWSRVDTVRPEHTKYGYMGHSCDMVQSREQFDRALAGTRIGAVFAALQFQVGRLDELELTAIANCARRPQLEYLAKCGQAKLAGELLRMERMPKGVIARPRAKSPREMLGLTEGQWFEARRDGIQLSVELLERAHILRRMGLGDMKLREIAEIRPMGFPCTYELNRIAPSPRAPSPAAAEYSYTVGDQLIRAGVGEKLRKKVYRRILKDIRHVSEWHDYYGALRRLGEDMTDPRLLLPKDMMLMHDRMYARIEAIREEEERQRQAFRALDFAARLEKLRAAYGYSACGLVLRPYESAREVVDEGKALGICIGGYAKRYLAGDTVICCLRRAEEPDEPWRAVEFSAQSGMLVQDRGFHNDRDGIDEGTRRQLRNFWALWRKAHDTKGRRRTA